MSPRHILSLFMRFIDGIHKVIYSISILSHILSLNTREALQGRLKRVFLVSLFGIILVGVGCSSPKQDSVFKDEETIKTIVDCSSIEPKNPFSSGGHYAGFKWGESGKSCGGNSQSFIAGCEEYFRQEQTYKTCLEKNPDPLHLFD